jgi:hypothetical protein
VTAASTEVKERKPGEPITLEHLPVVKLNEDGTVTCRGCHHVITFLPETFPAEELPDGAPRSVNHSGCPNAIPEESPAGPDAHTGRHETINRIDQAEVQAFYERKVKAAEAAAAK